MRMRQRLVMRETAYTPKIGNARNCVYTKDDGRFILRFFGKRDRIEEKSAVRRMLL